MENNYCRIFVIAAILVACYVDNVKSNCILSMKLDLSFNQPLILSTTTSSWYPLESSPKGSLQISRDESVKLVCPGTPAVKNAFSIFPLVSEVLAKCQQGNRFEVDKKTYTFDQLQCSTSVRPSTLKTGKPCMSGLTELTKVGYDVGGSFVPVYEVCYDKEKRVTLYAEVELSPNYVKNDAPVRESVWSNDNSYGDANLRSEYTCDGQIETFYKILGKNFFQPGEKCCYAKAQLVNSRDVSYGTEQIATYHYLNTAPQWSTCNNRANWVEVENRVRALATSLRRPLRVWTGGARVLRLRTKWLITNSDMYMHYNSKSDRAVPIPLYIWKVVHDPQTRKSLAIIQVNKPELTQADLESYVLCPDICHNVNWMNFLARKNIGSGYVYCCDLNDFEFSFQFKTSPFPKNAGNILRDDTK